ncbi:MAG: sigma 54-interacting transcriptional regulator [Blastocatellia bacterium]|nr:sigma 54-interacting transcriptional regulator [Blastocatellia bacterium]
MSSTNGYVVIGLLGPTLDSGKGAERWERWRPTVALCRHENFLIKRLELLYQEKFKSLLEILVEDIKMISPETQVKTNVIDFEDPWDFEQVYGSLHDFARKYEFKTDKEDYLIHITTGTHVAQICMFLLTESHYFPAKLIQTSPPSKFHTEDPGNFTIIDLDLSKYDRIASRFNLEQVESISFLKSGIETKNRQFNRLIERIEQVAISSKAPILLMGPTGAGKSNLAKRIYELRRSKHLLEGRFVDINCATIRGDAAMSALFGHVKGSFTGAVQSRPGLLRAADGGLLFLDEIGELGLDEQAMLLRALEEKVFMPMGADTEVSSDFQLIAGTNRDLALQVREGKFREDLLARINLWTFRLPGLKDRLEDVEPNLNYELEKSAQHMGKHITISKEAREKFLRFAVSSEAVWSGNFRDLNAAVIRMATLALGGRISVEVVEEEIERLRAAWHDPKEQAAYSDRDAELLLESLIGFDAAAELDRFDRVQLLDVLQVCKQSNSLSEAGRTLFASSRGQKKNINDADRLRKYLARFSIRWQQIKGEEE